MELLKIITNALLGIGFARSGGQRMDQQILQLVVFKYRQLH